MNEVFYDNWPDDEWDEPDCYEEDDWPFDYPDEPIPPEFEAVSGKSRLVITRGEVWMVDVITYADGHREGSRRQLEDTCWNGRMPF